VITGVVQALFPRIVALMGFVGGGEEEAAAAVRSGAVALMGRVVKQGVASPDDCVAPLIASCADEAATAAAALAHLRRLAANFPGSVERHAVAGVQIRLELVPRVGALLDGPEGLLPVRVVGRHARGQVGEAKAGHCRDLRRVKGAQIAHELVPLPDGREPLIAQKMLLERHAELVEAALELGDARFDGTLCHGAI
jgi:hypothetical protein